MNLSASRWGSDFGILRLLHWLDVGFHFWGCEYLLIVEKYTVSAWLPAYLSHIDHHPSVHPTEWTQLCCYLIEWTKILLSNPPGTPASLSLCLCVLVPLSNTVSPTDAVTAEITAQPSALTSVRGDFVRQLCSYKILECSLLITTDKNCICDSRSH